MSHSNPSSPVSGANGGQTTLSGTLLDQPWNGYTFGQGIDALTGQPADTAVAPFTVDSASSYDTTTNYTSISSQSDYQATFSAEASGSYNMQQGGQVSGSAAYLQSVSYSDTSFTIIAYYDIETAGYGTAPAWQLTADAQQKANADPDGFRDLYGDYFVANCTMGSRFVATYTCSASTSESLQSFQASIQGSTDMFTVSGATSFSQQAQSSSIDVSVAIYMEGVSGASPAPSTDPTGIPTSLNWFLTNLAYVQRRAELVQYSQLDPSLPNTLDIDPVAFANVQTLGFLIAQINASLTTLPPYYSNTAIYQQGATFGAAFTLLNDTFLAARADLPQDASLTASLTQQAQDMTTALQQPLAVYAFYQGLQQVANNSGETAGLSGSGSATYGLTDGAGTTPVTVSCIFQTISESGHAGHRTGTFNWPFGGADDSQIVTGWYMHCVWGQGGDDGSWTVQTPLIGRNSGEITVRGDYDRGIDWTLYVSYVETSNFPWLNT